MCEYITKVAILSVYVTETTNITNNGNHNSKSSCISTIFFSCAYQCAYIRLGVHHELPMRAHTNYGHKTNKNVNFNHFFLEM